ncbi:MAG: HAD family hydrolase [Anaerolineales bacterium]
MTDQSLRMALILFDFDGVLADTLDDMLNFAQAVCMELGIDRIPTPADLDALETMSFVEYGKQLGFPPALADEFASRCLRRFVERTHPPKMFNGMAQVFERLAVRNTLAIVTGNTTRAVENFLVENGIRQYVSAIFAVDQPGSKGEKILKAKTQLARTNEAVYYIGDAVSDIQVARQVSAKSVAVSWGHQSLNKLVKAKPDHIVHSPQEIIAVFRKNEEL